MILVFCFPTKQRTTGTEYDKGKQSQNKITTQAKIKRTQNNKTILKGKQTRTKKQERSKNKAKHNITQNIQATQLKGNRKRETKTQMQRDTKTKQTCTLVAVVAFCFYIHI